MGLSSLTRYTLFMESGDYISNGDGVIQFSNPVVVRDMYYDSASLIRGFEDIVNSGNDSLSTDQYQSMFARNARDIQNKLFVDRITELIQNQVNEKKGKEICRFQRPKSGAVNAKTKRLLAFTIIIPSTLRKSVKPPTIMPGFCKRKLMLWSIKE